MSKVYLSQLNFAQLKAERPDLIAAVRAEAAVKAERARNTGIVKLAIELGASLAAARAEVQLGSTVEEAGVAFRGERRGVVKGVAHPRWGQSWRPV
jgi:hypothetical protein